ncbi:MAG TPA: RodZ domain-containing protein [Steroidobacteraceae bacterium]|nr:RodZ domain-containing protein [Steroidobacteraceae bacterium]
MSDAAAREADTAGARLARARARAGMTVDQVADKLRLDRSTIVALEADDYRSIGAAVFVRGFLRRFATLVGESPAEIEALYAQRPDAELRPDLSRTGMHRIEADAHGRKLGLVPAVVAALVLGVAGAVWWAMRTKPQSYTMVTEEHTQVGAAAPSATSPAASGAAPPDATAGRPVDAAAATPSTAPAAMAPAEPPQPRRALELAFSSECWAEVYDARGYRLYFGFGHAGTTQTLNGVPPFRLVLGNVPGVAVSLAGAGVSLPEAAPGARVRFTLDASGKVTGVH